MFFDLNKYSSDDKSSDKEDEAKLVEKRNEKKLKITSSSLVMKDTNTFTLTLELTTATTIDDEKEEYVLICDKQVGNDNKFIYNEGVINSLQQQQQQLMEQQQQLVQQQQ
ncbi:hypothetical protein ABK040_014896 [Willaertia magna]